LRGREGWGERKDVYRWEFQKEDNHLREEINDEPMID
jgi:hypothetical protein